MLKKILTFALLNLIFSGLIFSQGIIVDHTSTDVSAIPNNIIDSIKQNIKFHWCGQSHSHQITAGLDSLESDFPNLNATIGLVELPEPNGSLCVMEGLNWGEYAPQCSGYWVYIAPHLYWSGPKAYGNVKQTLFNCQSTINISAFEWCGELENNTSEYVQSYLDSISVYEQMYPEVTFIYTTGHAQSSGINGYTRHQNNKIIRQYCIDNNKVLYDFGDLDCWSNGEFSYYLYEGDTIPIQHSDYDGEIIHHTTEESCKIKAKAIWYLMARLSGWEREINIDLKVNLEGPFNGVDMNTSLNSSDILPLSHPYNIAPWNYNGTESVVAIPNVNVVEWVLVELRDASDIVIATGETVVGIRAGFLLSDGSIVDLDGIGPLKFTDFTVNENLYAVVRHLNHLDIIGTNPASLIADTYHYDFTISENQAFGGINGHKEIATDIWGMFSGDGNADGIINIDDKNTIWLNQTGQSGYKAADFDIGGKVDNKDKNEQWLENLNQQSQVPN